MSVQEPQTSFADMLAQLAANGEPPDPRTDIDAASLRARFPHVSGVDIVERRIDTPTGSQPARLYIDRSAQASGRALVWVHGGAFIIGTLDMPEANWVGMELAAAGIPVLSVEYTKSHGSAHYRTLSDDVMAAWRHALEHAEELFGVAASRVLIGGASAGGTLSGGVIVRLRDAGEPLPAGLLAAYPAMHPDGQHPGAKIDPDDRLAQIAVNYAGSVEATEDPVAFAGNGSVAGFPPTFVVVCEHDFLLPSVESFASALAEADVAVTRWEEPGAEHGHLNEPGDPGAVRTLAGAAAWIAALP